MIIYVMSSPTEKCLALTTRLDAVTEMRVSSKEQGFPMEVSTWDTDKEELCILEIEMPNARDTSRVE